MGVKIPDLPGVEPFLSAINFRVQPLCALVPGSLNKFDHSLSCGAEDTANVP